MSTDNERPPSCQLKTDRLGPVPPSTVQCRHRSADRTPAGDGFNNCLWRLDRVAAKMHVSCESAVPSTFGSQILQVASALKKVLSAIFILVVVIVVIIIVLVLSLSLSLFLSLSLSLSVLLSYISRRHFVSSTVASHVAKHGKLWQREERA